MRVSFSLKELVWFILSLHCLHLVVNFTAVCTIDVSFHRNRLSDTSPVKSSVMEVRWEFFGPAPATVYVYKPFNVWRGLKGGIVYVLPLRVEPHISQTLVWPAAGELLSLYHCANLVLRLWGEIRVNRYSV